jgi:very-long-chain enoyl-CoA reductase
MEIEIVTGSKKSVCTLSNLSPTTTIQDIKNHIHKKKSHLYPERQALKIDQKGKTLKDDDTIKSLSIQNGSQLFLKDLGPQLGWSTVFLTEYAGPLVIYLWIYSRPALFYGEQAASLPVAPVVHIAAACWAFHYAKRLLETLFVHRFSHSTMPLRNLFKNCSYYWIFAGYVAYYVNHPLYTPPILGSLQVFSGLVGFLFCEFGNLSTHLTFRNLRPPGSKERKIPKPTQNPFTWMFDFVSCPNYTYEVGAWMAFTAMTQCLPAGLFTFAGFYQMAIWALGKHNAYKKEFPNYPRSRKAIVPFVI